MADTKNIMIVGVGGQGTLLASKILGHLLIEKGFDVKVSEVHGMSQRGGSVVTYVRYGNKVYSPIIDKGQADYILSFELLEAARVCEFLNKESGIIITNSQKINPMPVIVGNAKYPEDIAEQIEDLGLKIDVLDAVSLAEQAGFAKSVNIVLLGRMSKYFDFDIDDWKDAIKSCVKPQFLDINLKAFELGRNF